MIFQFTTTNVCALPQPHSFEHATTQHPCSEQQAVKRNNGFNGRLVVVMKPIAPALSLITEISVLPGPKEQRAEHPDRHRLAVDQPQTPK